MEPMHEDPRLLQPYDDEPFPAPSAGWRQWAYEMAARLPGTESEHILANCLLITLRALHEAEKQLASEQLASETERGDRSWRLSDDADKARWA